MPDRGTIGIAANVRMKKGLFLLIAFSFSFTLHAKPIKIMLVTGGHAFDTIQFFQLFDSLEGIEYEYFTQPAANQALVKGVAHRFDVLVFYDLWNTITEEQKRAYIKLTNEGKPFLFLHHSLASYQKWSKFE
ncbi:MAG: hypothetical protein J7L95_01615 [Prolixibacteraceae bacterium]|nr:hypothetical protein [Prolixibacteraceae bacterium]